MSSYSHLANSHPTQNLFSYNPKGRISFHNLNIARNRKLVALSTVHATTEWQHVIIFHTLLWDPSPTGPPQIPPHQCRTIIPESHLLNIIVIPVHIISSNSQGNFKLDFIIPIFEVIN